jgi:hypothetical protein
MYFKCTFSIFVLILVKKQRNLEELTTQEACAAAGEQPLVAGRPQAPHRWSTTLGLQVAVGRSKLANDHRSPIGRGTGPLCSKAALPSSYPHFFPYVVNSSSLAPAHARPDQTLPKSFKHP